MYVGAVVGVVVKRSHRRPRYRRDGKIFAVRMRGKVQVGRRSRDGATDGMNKFNLDFLNFEAGKVLLIQEDHANLARKTKTREVGKKTVLDIDGRACHGRGSNQTMEGIAGLQCRPDVAAGESWKKMSSVVRYALGAILCVGGGIETETVVRQ